MNNSSKRFVTLVLLGWLCFALGLGGWFQNASAPAVAATVWTLTALALLACWRVRPIKVWALNVGLRWLVLFHITRLFAGAYFLVLCRRGELPCAFARPAGWGDIIVAVFALAVVAAMRTQFAKEHDWIGRYHFRCLQCASVRSNRLAINARATGTAAQSPADVPGAANYRVARFDFRSACATRNSSR